MLRDLSDIFYITDDSGKVTFRDKTYATKDHLAAALARRERMAGTQLTHKQHLEGFISDTRSRADQIRDGHFMPVPITQTQPERNIFRSHHVEELIADQRSRRGLNTDRRALYKVAAEQEDERLSALDAKAAFDADPARVKVRAAAEHALELAMFSKDSTPELLVQTKRLKIQADHDIATAQKMYVEIMDALQARADARRAQLDAETADLYSREGFETPKPKPSPGTKLGYWPSIEPHDPRAEEKRAENEEYVRVHGAPPRLA